MQFADELVFCIITCADTSLCCSQLDQMKLVNDVTRCTEGKS